MNIYKAKDFVDNELPLIHIDRAFQRKLCWLPETSREYIKSANQGEAPYPIVVADVITGMQHSEDKLDDQSKRHYEKAARLRKDYISLDGQQRTGAWYRLFKDELTLSGSFIDADGKEVIVDNKYYSNLPIRLQDALRDTEICLKIIKSKLYDKLHDIFVKINSGDALNAQEMRNAINTEISAFIRQRAEQIAVAKMWPRIWSFSSEQINRSQDAEWTAKAFMATLPNSKHNLGAREMDTFYLKGKGKFLKNVPEYSRHNQHRFSGIMEEVRKVTEAVPLVAQKTWWMCLYAVESVIVDKQNSIIDYSEFYEIIQRIDNGLITNSRKQMGKDIADWEANGKPEADEPSSFDYYYQWASDPGSSARRKSRKAAFFAELWSDAEFLTLLERSRLVAA